MIVICTKCQAKFRVADDKIGPRGAKVRCSRCQSIFQVHRAAATPPAPAAAEAAPPSPPPLAARRPAMDVDLENPFVSGALRAPAQAPPEPAASPEPDPFAAAGFATSFEQEAPEPFAAPPGGDPFAPAASEADPFAPPPAPARTAQGEAMGLATTDLSDLLGLPSSGSPQPSELAPGPTELGAPMLPPPVPGITGGLALEDRLTPPPVPALARPGLDVGFGAQACEPFGSDPQALGSYELGAAEGDLALATEEPAPPEPPAPVPPPAPAALELAPPAPAPPRPAAAPGAAAPLAEERIRPPRASRLRVLVVNAMSLAALVLVAAAMLVVWRGGSLEAAALRPSALLAALRGGGGGPFAALEVRSGWYEREKGPPLLFVRGRVISRAASPVSGVKVTVEIVHAKAVVARGEALAGAVPTPEELHEAADATALAALAEVAGARAPDQIRPGDAVPFLVAIAEAPPDLDGATVRVALAETGVAAR